MPLDLSDLDKLDKIVRNAIRDEVQPALAEHDPVERGSRWTGGKIEIWPRGSRKQHRTNAMPFRKICDALVGRVATSDQAALQNLATVSISASASMGFFKTAEIRVSVGACSANAEMTTMGISARSSQAPNLPRTSQPSTTGIMRSRSTTHGRCLSWRSQSASAPLRAAIVE